MGENAQGPPVNAKMTFSQKCYFNSFMRRPLSYRKQSIDLLPLIHTIPKLWKLAALNDQGNCKNIYLNHHVIENNQGMEKVIPKELYSLSLVLKNELRTNQKYFSTIFPNLQVEWTEISLLSRKVSIDTNLAMSQYKILRNVLYLNKQLLFLIKEILTVDYVMK